MTKKGIALTGEEIAILSKLSTETLRDLAAIKTNGKAFAAINAIIQLVIDTEKNYSFALNEDENLAQNHAYSRGKASFGATLIHLIAGSSNELSRREQIQDELRKKQLKGEKNE